MTNNFHRSGVLTMLLFTSNAAAEERNRGRRPLAHGSTLLHNGGADGLVDRPERRGKGAERAQAARTPAAAVAAQHIPAADRPDACDVPARC